MTDIAAEPPVIKRRHVTAAVVGNALEFYDFTTYAFFAVQIGHAFFPSGAGGVRTAISGTPATTAGTEVIMVTEGKEPFPRGT